MLWAITNIGFSILTENARKVWAMSQSIVWQRQVI